MGILAHHQSFHAKILVMSKKKILALCISLAFLGLIFHKIDWVQLIKTFKHFDVKKLWLIVPLYVSTLYLRGIRWKSLLLDNPKYSAFNLGAVFTVGSMLNIFLPARAGDVYRAYYIGAAKEEKKMKLFGSIILERTFDGICVFFVLLWAILAYCSSQPLIVNLAYMIGFLFIGSFIAFYLIYKFNKVDFIFEKLILICKKLPEKPSVSGVKILESLNAHINSFIEGFEVLDSPKCTLEAFLMSVIIWGIECCVAFLIINSFHMNLGFSTALFVVSLISFSTMIPSTSVFLGPYQAAYILALGIYAVNKSTALAVATVHQGILMIILSVIGGFYLLKFNLETKNLKNEVFVKNANEIYLSQNNT